TRRHGARPPARSVRALTRRFARLQSRPPFAVRPERWFPMLDRFTWFRQAAMRYAGEGITIYIDPWGTSPEDPKADLILITHAHFDHLQPHEIERLSTEGTHIVATHDAH